MQTARAWGPMSEKFVKMIVFSNRFGQMKASPEHSIFSYNKQSGTKPNLVAKILDTKFGFVPD